MKKTIFLTTSLWVLVSIVGYSQTSYKINPTGQTLCYGVDGKVIKTPKVGDKLYGQDGNYVNGATFSFKDNGDGTITDNTTGLMWQQTPPISGMTWAEAKKYCEELEYGGYSDWRLPTLKELFSISDFSQGWPYLDTVYFKLASGMVTKNEQFWADNKYVGVTVEGRGDAAFGVNHVTGHIKAYPAGSNMKAGGNQPPRMAANNRQGGREGQMPPPPQGGQRGGQPEGQQGGQQGGRQGGQQGGRPGGQQGGRPMGNPMAKMVRAVRGEIYGANNFVDNGDGTITDNATGLMWSKADNGKGVEWTDALQYSQNATLANYTDWRLPNVKELQSIVDYSKAPSASGAVAAIDAIFVCTPTINEAGDNDFGYYWTSTSACFTKGRPFYFAWYVAFGRAVNNKGLDFHGAGAVRFDSKSNNGLAVEGGEERYFNYIRLVRNLTLK